MSFNSKQYAWNSVKVFMFGRVITGLRGVQYTVKKDKEAVHGAGDEPMSIQPGNKTYEGSVDVLQSELEAMIAAAKKAGYADITDVPGFNIVVSYANVGQVPTSDTLTGCEFTEMPKGMKQGDKFSEHSLPIMFLRLKPQS